TAASANIIAAGKNVKGEIMAAANDVDWFKIAAPPAPRDRLTIEVGSRSRLLNPMLKIYNSEHGLVEWTKTPGVPGGKVAATLSPAPNATLYLAVAGFGDSAGLYTVRVMPLKAFDSYEPNDDIFNARPIHMGVTVGANIMDKTDMDY